MKKVIFYFSATGNSLHAARTAAVALGGAELIAIPAHAEGYDAGEVDAAGIVFPVYAWAGPRMVEAFLSKLTMKSGYTFVIATHGGWPANTLRQIEKILNCRSIAVDAAFDVRMPDNYVPMYSPPDTAKSKEINDIADSKLAEICKRIAVRDKVPSRASLKHWPMSVVAHRFFMLGLSQNQAKNFVVGETCTGCSICERVCPASNITESKTKKPIWGKNCEQCMACIHWCPAKAIHWKKLDEDRNRYHHPAVKANDLFKP